MKKSFTNEQIVAALRQAEERKFAGMGIAELSRLRELEEENGRLKSIVADLTRDKHMLQEVVRRKSEGGPAPGDREVARRSLRDLSPARLPPGAHRLVQLPLQAARQGPHRPEDPPQRPCRGSPKVRLPPTPRAGAPGGAGGEPQARVPAVQSDEPGAQALKAPLGGADRAR